MRTCSPTQSAASSTGTRRLHIKGSLAGFVGVLAGVRMRRARLCIHKGARRATTACRAPTTSERFDSVPW